MKNRIEDLLSYGLFTNRLQIPVMASSDTSNTFMKEIQRNATRQSLLDLTMILQIN